MNIYIESALRFANDLGNCLDLAADYLKDRSKPLAERWEAYCLIERYLPDEDFGNGFIEKLGLDSVYDDLGVERYQTRRFVDLYETFLEDVEWSKTLTEEDHDAWTKTLEERYTQEKLDEWREAVLASGYGSFTFDW